MKDKRQLLIGRIIDTFGIKADGVYRPLATPDNLADFIEKEIESEVEKRRLTVDEVKKSLKI